MFLANAAAHVPTLVSAFDALSRIMKITSVCCFSLASNEVLQRKVAN